MSLSQIRTQCQPVAASFLRYLAIPRAILSYLCDPIYRIMPANQVTLQPRPVPPMPKIAIAENHDSCGAEDDVWLAWQISGVLAIPKPEPRKLAAQQNLV